MKFFYPIDKFYHPSEELPSLDELLRTEQYYCSHKDEISGYVHCNKDWDNPYGFGLCCFDYILKDLEYKGNTTDKSGFKRFGLSDVEKVVLMLFYTSNVSDMFYPETYTGYIPLFAKHLHSILDNVIAKAPLFTGGKEDWLFRMCRPHDQVENLKKEMIISTTHTLTATTWDFSHPVGGAPSDTAYYIIPATALGKTTKAHCLYKIYDCGGERQVNFERETQFKVLKIEEYPTIPYLRAFLAEIS